MDKSANIICMRQLQEVAISGTNFFWKGVQGFRSLLGLATNMRGLGELATVPPTMHDGKGSRCVMNIDGHLFYDIQEKKKKEVENEEASEKN